jgi:hypothetical protein
MNYHNLAQKTNFLGGSDKFENLPFYITTLNIPGITFSFPEVGGRFSKKVYLPAGTMTFNNLTFEFLIDEDFGIYRDFMNHIKNIVDVKNGTFSDETFSFWIQLNNNKGNEIMKLEFYNCRIENIGDISLSTQEDVTEHLMSLEFKFDYYEIVDDILPVPEGL